MKQVVLIAILSLDSALAGCRSSPGDGEASTAKTDLGSAGNSRVAAAFAAYQEKSEHCAAAGGGKRVMLTGFGLFSGADFNPSGTVVSSFADPDFQPAAITLGEANRDLDSFDASSSAADGQGPVADGRVDDSSHGGIARNRTLTINGQAYEVCFLTLDVLWDLGGAIIATEAHTFQPELIIMSGRNSDNTAVWESGAINDAAALSGYNSNGTSASDNLPTRDHAAILKAFSPRRQVAMSWSNSDILSATSGLISGINSKYSPVAPRSWRSGNNYICNNVSLVALGALQGKTLSLAGGRLVLTPYQTSMPSDAKVGFFHYPVDTTNGTAEIKSWIKVLATAIVTELPPDSGAGS